MAMPQLSYSFELVSLCVVVFRWYLQGMSYKTLAEACLSYATAGPNGLYSKSEDEYATEALYRLPFSSNSTTNLHSSLGLDCRIPHAHASGAVRVFNITVNKVAEQEASSA
jgi:hypothetical protein